MPDRSIIGRKPTLLPYHGWLVVAAAFLVALYGFGLGFYGPGIYLVALKALHGWPTSELSSAITTYYVLGATLLFFWVGPLFDRHGARKVVVVLCQEGARAPCCTRDEGGPFGAVLWGKASNRHELLRSKAAVVNVMVKRRDVDHVRYG